MLDLDAISDDETLKILNLIKLSIQGLKKYLDENIDHLKLDDPLEINTQQVSFDEALKVVKATIITLIEAYILPLSLFLNSSRTVVG